MDYAEPMYRILVIFLSLIVVTASAETVYRSVDPDGNIIYSDVETPDAEPVEVKELPTVNLPKAPDFEYEKQENDLPYYREIKIVSPKNDETIRENAGNVAIHANIQPSLRGGHVLVIALDGKEVSSGRATSINLENVDRGSHSVTATVKDRGGETIAGSEPVTFHLLRVSVQHPPPPAKPAAKP